MWGKIRILSNWESSQNEEADSAFKVIYFKETSESTKTSFRRPVRKQNNFGMTCQNWRIIETKQKIDRAKNCSKGFLRSKHVSSQRRFKLTCTLGFYSHQLGFVSAKITFKWREAFQKVK